MHTEWRRANLRDHEHLKSEARHGIRNGRRLFIDTGVLAHPDATPEARSALEGEFAASKPFGVSGRKYHIQFAELHPKRREKSLEGLAPSGRSRLAQRGLTVD
ncbi:MAG: hypothetical protein EXQ52_16815 [Bryobacterales bacterium]|nr:hypothetical protein [Bryobacterales bacterium]